MEEGYDEMRSEKYVLCFFLLSLASVHKHPFSWTEMCSSTKIASIDRHDEAKQIFVPSDGESHCT